jgi:hypothetical protein
MRRDVHVVETLNRHGKHFEVFGSQPAAEKAAATYCEERYAGHIVGKDFSTLTSRQFVDHCLAEYATDDDNIEFGVVSVEFPDN